MKSRYVPRISQTFCKQVVLKIDTSRAYELSCDFFTVSVLTIGGLILHLAMELSLHWNPQFYLNPVPFHLTFASAYILGLNGKFTFNAFMY